MKLRNILLGFVILSSTAAAYAIPLHSVDVNPNHNKLRSDQNEAAVSKTEIYIVNDSNKVVYIRANDYYMGSLMPNHMTRLYNDEDEVSQVFIQMSLSPSFYVDKDKCFFNDYVPNHATLKVKDYLPEVSK